MSRRYYSHSIANCYFRISSEFQKPLYQGFEAITFLIYVSRGCPLFYKSAHFLPIIICTCVNLIILPLKIYRIITLYYNLYKKPTYFNTRRAQLLHLFSWIE